MALAAPFSIEAQIVVGNCNIVLKDVKVTGGTVKMGDLGCPEDPAKTLRIGYFWLDSTSVSFLLSGVNYGALRDLVGAAPVVVQNETYRVARRLIDEFGSNIDNSSLMAADYFRVGVGNRRRGEDAGRGDPRAISAALRKVIKVYDAKEVIYNADLAASTHVYTTQQWPPNYRLYYTSKGSSPLRVFRPSSSIIEADELFGRSVLWRYVTRDELVAYPERVRAIRERAEKSKSLAHLYIPHDVQTQITLSERESEQIEKAAKSQEQFFRLTALAEIGKLASLAQSPSLRAMLHITRENFPPDFLAALGFIEGHGSYDSWAALIPPRQLFVQIALIENVGGSGATYKVAGFNARRSARSELRASEADGAEADEFVPFTPAILSKGDKVVVPLRIEFRSSLEFGREDAPTSLTPSSKAAAEVQRALASLSPDAVLKNGVGSIAKRRSAFGSPEAPEMKRAYLYGPRYTLSSIAVDGRTLPLRQYDPNNVFMIAGFDGGSCPVLFVQRSGVAEPIKIGTILRSANGAQHGATEQIDLGTDVEEIHLLEQEPERTTVQELTVFRVDRAGNRHLAFALPAPVSINYGQGLTLTPSKGEPGERYVLRIRGYYETYESLARSSH